MEAERVGRLADERVYSQISEVQPYWLAEEMFASRRSRREEDGRAEINVVGLQTMGAVESSPGGKDSIRSAGFVSDGSRTQRRTQIKDSINIWYNERLVGGG